MTKYNLKKITHLILLSYLGLYMPNTYAGWGTGDGSNAKDSDGNDVGHGDSGSSGGREGDGGGSGFGGFYTPKPVYETRYRLVNTQRKLSYIDAYGRTKSSYPHEALAILYMYQNASSNEKYYIQTANFKNRTSNYQYTSESFGQLQVNYNLMGNSTIASLTKSPSLNNGAAANEAAFVKKHLLAYLDLKDFSSLNFNFEQQFNLKDCSWNAIKPTTVGVSTGGNWSCNIYGKKRMLLPFKLLKGQNDAEAGAFYGASIEPDPDDNTTVSTPEAKLKDGSTLNITYYANDPFPDFYKNINNASALARYEPDNEIATLINDKLSGTYGGWFSGERIGVDGTKTTLDIASDFGAYNFDGEIPLHYAITSGNPDPLANVQYSCDTLTDQTEIDLCLQEQANNPPSSNSALIYDIFDRYRTMQNSMTKTTQCFFPERDGSNTCSFDVSEMLSLYQASKLNIKLKSRFIVDSIIGGNFQKTISYDYCLSPNLTEVAKMNYKVKQFETTRSYAIDTNGQLNNVTLNTDLTPINITTLPDPVSYYIDNFTWERNSVFSDTKGNKYNSDTVFTERVLDVTKASLYQDGQSIFVGNLDFMTNDGNYPVSINKIGNDDTSKAWSCDETFLPYVQAEISKVNQMCGSTPKVVNYSLIKDNGSGLCKAEYTANDTCVNNPIPQENVTTTTDPVTGTTTSTTTITMVDNYEWTNQSIINISLPSNGEACTETCYVNDGVRTSGYCSWRETNTGRKYRP